METIDVGFNFLKSLQPLSSLKNIVTLLCNNNQLVTLDVELTNFKRLVTLQLKSNPLLYVSIQISECILLQELGLSETFIVTLPATMSKLKKLKKLDLGECEHLFFLKYTIVSCLSDYKLTASC